MHGYLKWVRGFERADQDSEEFECTDQEFECIDQESEAKLTDVVCDGCCAGATMDVMCRQEDTELSSVGALCAGS